MCKTSQQAKISLYISKLFWPLSICHIDICNLTILWKELDEDDDNIFGGTSLVLRFTMCEYVTDLVQIMKHQSLVKYILKFVWQPRWHWTQLITPTLTLFLWQKSTIMCWYGKTTEDLVPANLSFSHGLDSPPTNPPTDEDGRNCSPNQSTNPPTNPPTMGGIVLPISPSRWVAWHWV